MNTSRWILTAAALAAAAACSTPSVPEVVIYEDGSGVQYQGDTEVRTFPEGTFATP